MNSQSKNANGQINGKSATQSAPQVLRGIVTGCGKMDKTVTVNVERKVWHGKLHKQFTRSKNYLAHCEDKNIEQGDAVTMEKCRPMSKRKNFRVVKIEKKKI